MSEPVLDSGVTYVLSCLPEALLKRTQNLGGRTCVPEVKSEERFFSCEGCERNFLSQGKLLAHRKQCSNNFGNDEVTISLCERESGGTSEEDTSYSLDATPVIDERHMFVCVVCTQEFGDIHKFIDHIKEHKLTKVKEEWPSEFRCEVFQNEFSDDGGGSKHGQNHGYNPPKPYSCGICGKRFRFKVSLTRHIKCVHKNEKRFACDLCHKLFFEKSNLVKHLRVHTGDRPFACKVCHKQFRQASSMRLHMKIHTNEDRFVCEICDRSFPVESSLKKHLDRHEVVLEFRCSTCLLTFPTNSTYKKHLLTHTGDRAFACSMCDKRFYHKGHLTEHVRVHTGEKPFECRLCQKRFTQRTALTQHNSRFHMNGKPFTCDLCGESFARKCDVKVHRQTTKCS